MIASAYFFGICMIFATANAMGMPGGWTTENNLNSSKILQLAGKAAYEISKEMNSEHILKVIKIEKAEKQVVAGMNHKFDFLIGTSECKTSENLTSEEIENCPLKKCGDSFNCTAKLWSKEWQQFYKVTHFSCNQSESTC